MSHRILIIDDSPSVLANLSAGLRSDDYEVRTLSRFTELGHTLETFEPQVIVLDLQMPGFDGIQFARFVRRFCDVTPPILLHSGMPVERVEKAALEIRPFEIIAKGTSIRELRRSVGRALAQSYGWNTFVDLGSSDASGTRLRRNLVASPDESRGRGAAPPRPRRATGTGSEH